MKLAWPAGWMGRGETPCPGLVCVEKRRIEVAYENISADFYGFSDRDFHAAIG
jgi:hypothetical protein